MKQPSHPAYRPDIDGMRAIAVLSVLLFHIDKKLMPGGFAGVDIFFVISGFLITFHIYGQMCAGTFTFSEFYRRRINRIAPALFALIAGVCSTGLLILSPTDLIKLLKSAVYACVGLSNIFFWCEYGNYFSHGIDEAPLLHTWSLAVEEQFYIIWPVLLLVLVRIKPIYRYFFIGLGVLAATAFSELGTQNAASASYYLLPTRFFELLIGGALGVYVFHRQRPFGVYASNVLATAGAALMLGSLYMLNEKVPFPGLSAVTPCLGTALLIAAGTNPSSAISRTLGAKPLVFVGLISYSVYLWHWPLIAFTHYLGISIDAPNGTAIFLAAIGLGWISWKFIEMPFRHSSGVMSFRSMAIRRFLSPVAAIAVAFVAVLGTGGFPDRFDPRVSKYEHITGTAPNELRRDCHSPALLYERKPSASCILGVPSRPPEVLLIGDSFANHFTGMVDVMAKNDRVTVLDYTMDGCLPIKGMGFGSPESYAQKCKARNEFIYRYISSSKFEYVILAGSWPSNSNPKDFSALQAGLSESLAAVVAAGAKPVIIINNESTTNANCPARRLMSGNNENCDKIREIHKQRDAMFAALRAQFPQLSFVDPNQAICSTSVCRSMLGETPLYRDQAHLNELGSRAIGHVLVQKQVHIVPINSVVAVHP